MLRIPSIIPKQRYLTLFAYGGGQRRRRLPPRLAYQPHRPPRLAYRRPFGWRQRRRRLPPRLAYQPHRPPRLAYRRPLGWRQRRRRLPPRLAYQPHRPPRLAYRRPFGWGLNPTLTLVGPGLYGCPLPTSSSAHMYPEAEERWSSKPSTISCKR